MGGARCRQDGRHVAVGGNIGRSLAMLHEVLIEVDYYLARNYFNDYVMIDLFLNPGLAGTYCWDRHVRKYSVNSA